MKSSIPTKIKGLIVLALICILTGVTLRYGWTSGLIVFGISILYWFATDIADAWIGGKR